MKYLNCNKSIYFPETKNAFLAWPKTFVLSMAHQMMIFRCWITYLWYKIYKGGFFVFIELTAFLNS